jgi:type VI secretion system protein VasD
MPDFTKFASCSRRDLAAAPNKTLQVNRRRKLLLTGAIALLAAACSSPPKPPKPTVVALSVEAAANVNPDIRGRPSPVVLKIFELKSAASFERADFFALFDRERETLGTELVARDEMVLKPGDRITQNRKPAAETQFIGLVAGFRDLERAQWRLTIPVVAAQSHSVAVQLEAARISLKGK